MAYRKQQIKKTFSPDMFLAEKERNMFDSIYQSYVALAANRDSKIQIQKENFDIYIELLFNGLRFNTFITDKQYFNEYYSKVIDNDKIRVILENINGETKNGKEFNKSIQFFEEIVNNRLYDIVSLMYNRLMTIDVYKKNKYLHHIDDLFISIDNGKSIFLYKIEYTQDAIYGSHIIKLMEENNGSRQMSRFERFIREFNEINDVKIDSGNFISIDITKSKIKPIDAVKAFRCIHCTNKWFNKKGEFNMSLPYELFCSQFIQDDRFKYKF